MSRFEVDHVSIERRQDITASLIVWLEHASFHGAKSKTMIYCRDEHDARNVRWLCECIMPIYGGTVSHGRMRWTLPNGGILIINTLFDDESRVGHGGHALTMTIAVNELKWPHTDLTFFLSMLRNGYGIPSRFITTGGL